MENQPVKEKIPRKTPRKENDGAAGKSDRKSLLPAQPARQPGTPGRRLNFEDFTNLVSHGTNGTRSAEPTPRGSNKEHLTTIAIQRPILGQEQPCFSLRALPDSSKVVFEGASGAVSDYGFDRVVLASFGEDTVGPLFRDQLQTPVLRALEGYTSVVVAYGQTGSGKTTTMGTGRGATQSQRAEGQEGCGVAQHAILALFEAARRQAASPKAAPAEIEICGVQLSSEGWTDLLKESSGDASGAVAPPPPAPVPTPRGGGGAYGGFGYGLPSSGAATPRGAEVGIKMTDQTLRKYELCGQQWRRVASPEECGDLLRIITLGRETADNGFHANSSRTHLIVMLRVKATVVCEDGEGRRATGHVVLMDLAGSEKPLRDTALSESEDDRFNKGVEINKSLLVLRKYVDEVIAGGVKGSRRNHDLVFFIDTLLERGGSFHLFGCYSPAEEHKDESRNTLMFASRARELTSKPLRALEESEAEQLKRTIKDLQAQLSRDGQPAMASRLAETEKELAVVSSKYAELRGDWDALRGSLLTTLRTSNLGGMPAVAGVGASVSASVSSSVALTPGPASVGRPGNTAAKDEAFKLARSREYLKQLRAMGGSNANASLPATESAGFAETVLFHASALGFCDFIEGAAGAADPAAATDGSGFIPADQFDFGDGTGPLPSTSSAPPGPCTTPPAAAARKRRAMLAEAEEMRQRCGAVLDRAVSQALSSSDPSSVLRQIIGAAAGLLHDSMEKKDLAEAETIDRALEASQALSRAQEAEDELQGAAEVLHNREQALEAAAAQTAWLEAELASLRDQVAAEATRAGAAEARAADLASEAAGARGEADTAAQKLSVLQAEHEGLLQALREAQESEAERGRELSSALSAAEDLRADLAEALEEKKRLVRAVDAAESEARALSGTVDGLRAELDTSHRERDAMSDTLEASAAALEAVRGEGAALNEALRAEKDRGEGLRGQLESIRVEIESVRGRLGEAESERDGLRSQAEALTVRAQAADGERAIQAERLALLEPELVAVKEELGNAQAELSSVRQALESRDLQIESLKQQLSTADATSQASITELRQAAESEAATVATLRSRVSVLELQLAESTAAAESRQRELELEAAAACDAAAAVQAQCSDLEGQAQERDLSLAALQAAHEELRCQLVGAMSDSSSAAERASLAQSRAAAALQEAGDARAALTEAQSRVADLEGQLGALRVDFEAARTFSEEAPSLRAAAEGLRCDVDRLRAELDQRAADALAASVEHSVLRAAVQERDAAAAALRERIATLEAESASLLSALEASRSEQDKGASFHQAMISCLRTDYAAIKEQLDANQRAAQESDRKCEELRGQVRAQGVEVSEAEARAAEASALCSAAEHEKLQLEARLEALENELAGARSLMAGLEEEAARGSMRLRDAELAAEGSRAEAEGLARELAAARQALAATRENAGASSEEAGLLSNRLRAVEGVRRALEADLEVSQQKNRDQAAEIDALACRLAKADLRLAELQQEREGAEAALGSAREEEEALLRSRLSKALADLDSERAECAELKLSLEEAQLMSDTDQQEAKMARRENKKLEHRLFEASSAQSAAAQRVSELQGRVAELEAELRGAAVRQGDAADVQSRSAAAVAEANRLMEERDAAMAAGSEARRALEAIQARLAEAEADAAAQAARARAAEARAEEAPASANLAESRANHLIGLNGRMAEEQAGKELPGAAHVQARDGGRDAGSPAPGRATLFAHPLGDLDSLRGSDSFDAALSGSQSHGGAAAPDRDRDRHGSVAAGPGPADRREGSEHGIAGAASPRAGPEEPLSPDANLLAALQGQPDLLTLVNTRKRRKTEELHNGLVLVPRDPAEEEEDGPRVVWAELKKDLDEGKLSKTLGWWGIGSKAAAGEEGQEEGKEGGREEEPRVKKRRKTAREPSAVKTDTEGAAGAEKEVRKAGVPRGGAESSYATWSLDQLEEARATQGAANLSYAMRCELASKAMAQIQSNHARGARFKSSGGSVLRVLQHEVAGRAGRGSGAAAGGAADVGTEEQLDWGALLRVIRADRVANDERARAREAEESSEEEEEGEDDIRWSKKVPPKPKPGSKPLPKAAGKPNGQAAARAGGAGSSLPGPPVKKSPSYPPEIPHPVWAGVKTSTNGRTWGARIRTVGLTYTVPTSESAEFVAKCLNVIYFKLGRPIQIELTDEEKAFIKQTPMNALLKHIKEQGQQYNTQLAKGAVQRSTVLATQPSAGDCEAPRSTPAPEAAHPATHALGADGHGNVWGDGVARGGSPAAAAAAAAAAPAGGAFTLDLSHWAPSWGQVAEAWASLGVATVPMADADRVGAWPAAPAAQEPQERREAQAMAPGLGHAGVQVDGDGGSGSAGGSDPDAPLLRSHLGSPEPPEPADAVADGMSYKIYVRTYMGRMVSLLVRPDDIVLGLKARIEDKEGIPLDHQRLFLAERELEDESTMSDNNIQKESMVDIMQLLLTLPGRLQS